MLKSILTLSCLSLFSLSAQSALYDRGNGLIYDDVLDITWLQDTNYAQSSGYDDDGLMNWSETQYWLSELNYEGYTGWRLPTFDQANSTLDNVVYSEFGHMFYNNLGNRESAGDMEYCYTPEAPHYCFKNTSFIDADSGESVSLLNTQNRDYWLEGQIDGYNMMFFSAGGFHSYSSGSNIESYVWAVRDGDVSEVPLPAAFWLFCSGLLLLRAPRF